MTYIEQGPLIAEWFMMSAIEIIDGLITGKY